MQISACVPIWPWSGHRLPVPSLRLLQHEGAWGACDFIVNYLENLINHDLSLDFQEKMYLFRGGVDVYQGETLMETRKDKVGGGQKFI